MKKNIYYILLFLIALFYSCSDQTSSVINEISIKGQAVKIDSTNRYIGPKTIFGDVLYAWNMDLYGGKLSAKEWQKSDRLLASGSGHDEFAYMIISRDKNGELYVLNRSWVGAKFLSLVKIPHGDSIPAVKDKTKWERYNLKETPLFGPSGSNFTVLSDSTILVTGAPTDDICHLFSNINFKSQKVSTLDYWPADDMKCDDKRKNRRYVENSVVLGNNKGKFLYQNGVMRNAFIFSFNEANETSIISNLYSDSFSEKRPTEVLACCANEDIIYMLLRDSDCKGNKLKEWNNPFIFGNTIEVFDWDGEKQQIIHLDKYGQYIMLSEDNKTLYLVSDYSEETTEPFIFSYNLENAN